MRQILKGPLSTDLTAQREGFYTEAEALLIEGGILLIEVEVEAMVESASHAGEAWKEKDLKMATSIEVGNIQAEAIFGERILTDVAAGNRRPVTILGEQSVGFGNRRPVAILEEIVSHLVVLMGAGMAIQIMQASEEKWPLGQRYGYHLNRTIKCIAAITNY
jgi:hypothetical protein